MMTSFFALKLNLVLCLGLFILLSACNGAAPVETAVEAYWSALSQGDVEAAYAYLSEADKAYLDLEIYKDYLLEQPSMSFLLLAPPKEKAPPKKRWGQQRLTSDKGASVQVEVTETKVKGSRARTQMTLQLPDLRGLLDDELSAAASSQLPQEEELRAEMRLLRTLAKPVNSLSKARYSHIFNLVREERRWRIEVPHYRARAMLATAKALSADRDLEGAHSLLQTLAQLPASPNLVQTARRGRRMLPYLHRLDFDDFKQVVSASPGCLEAATVQIDNTGEFPVQTLEAVIEFRKGGEPMARQRVVLGNTDSLIRPGVKTPFELCLEPPKNWTGEAVLWASWLEFPEEVYKQKIR